MLRPGLHFNNTWGITDADLEIIEWWSPLSMLLVMNNVTVDDNQLQRLRYAWELAERPPIGLRKYFYPSDSHPHGWRVHAQESVLMAEAVMGVGIPVSYLILHPFNEPNMPEWGQWEGFGSKPEQISRYAEALHQFIDIVQAEMPGLRVGGPALTIGNRDVRFPNDPIGDYYYHGPDGKFESSRCASALDRLDCHFVHCYSFAPGDYKRRAYGLRFAEYEKYFSGKDIYICEGAYGISAGPDPVHNEIRGHETVDYLRIVGEQYPQVKGFASWIGGHTGWFAFVHSDAASNAHRPVVTIVKEAVENDEPPEPPPPPPEPSSLELKVYDLTGEKRTLDWAKATYGVGLEVKDGCAYHCILMQEREGPSSIDVYVYSDNGQPQPGVSIVFHWPDGQQEKITEADGKAGFAYGPGSWIYDPAKGGPHWIVVDGGNCDAVSGLGMLAGTVHRHLDLAYRLGELKSEPVSPPADYRLIERLEQAPYGFEDLRAEVEAISDMDKVKSESLAARRIDANGLPLFGNLETIVIHHSGGKPSEPMGLVRWAINECTTVEHHTAPYHFVIDPAGKIYWLVKIKYLTHHAAGLNDKGTAITLLGDYSDEQPPEKMLIAGRWLVAALYEFFGQGWGAFRLTGLIPHRNVWNGKDWHTACPGKVWPALLWSGPWPDLR